MKRQIYAGIGSRNTPLVMLDVMQKLGRMFARHGWLLRSGNCHGADQAFAQGANHVNSALVELFLPWPGYEQAGLVWGNVVHTPGQMAYDIAARYHPAWHHCNQAVRAMHARNVQIVLGVNLQSPVDLMICWTPKGQLTGGTAMAMRVALACGIQLRNLALTGDIAWAKMMMREIEWPEHEYAGQMEFGW